MDVLFEEKIYGFLVKTDIRFTIKVSGHDVWVTAYYLPPHVFNTAPVFLLTTDLPENDYLAKTISHKLYDANPETDISNSDLTGLQKRKVTGKTNLFEEVADQTGEIYDENILTIVFAKRFTGYKRADLLFYDMERFNRIVNNTERPVQLIWAGKPYPMDYTAIGIFDKIVNITKNYKNCSSLVGYELKLSKLLKNGADVWLNIPRLTHEASGTSGMAAAMNGAINVSTPDGWFPEFAKDKINSFVIPPAPPGLPDHEQDATEANNLYDLLEKEIIPMYYDYPSRWLSIIKNSMQDITPYFDSNRMAAEYYEKMYLFNAPQKTAQQNKQVIAIS